jgi:hypothetical protein
LFVLAALRHVGTPDALHLQPNQAHTQHKSYGEHLRHTRRHCIQLRTQGSLPQTLRTACLLLRRTLHTTPASLQPRCHAASSAAAACCATSGSSESRSSRSSWRHTGSQTGSCTAPADTQALSYETS